MFIAKVKGTVVTTHKVETMAGKKLLVVEPLQVDDPSGQFRPTGRCLVAVDNIDAGVDEIVLVTQGSSARMTESTGNAPVDCVVIGIIDSVCVQGKAVYSKG